MDNLKEIMQYQPIINVGTIGHVANGKSTLVKCLTSKETQQFSKEKERNITIRLGYANTKVWMCNTCSSPERYTSSASLVMSKQCASCKEPLELISHISIVDCPGHNELTSTMLNGSSVMDYAILVEACNNTDIPAPQTAEHLIATRASNIPTCMIIMNKLDLVKKETAKDKITKLCDFVKRVSNTEELPPVIPISASFNLNLDVVCQQLSQLTIPALRNPNDKFKMIVIRSFDVNKPGINVTKLHGGVIGGTITRGTLKIGDRISIYPGMTKRIDQTVDKEDNKKDICTDFKFDPITGEVLSIKSDTNELKFAIPGGLLGIQLTIDPAFSKSDNLSGSLVIKSDDVNTTDLKVYDKIIVTMNKYIMDQERVKKLLKDKSHNKNSNSDRSLMINVNSNNIDCELVRYSKTNNQMYLKLNRPIAIDATDNLVTIINCDKNRDILGRGIIVKGIECEKM